MKKEFTYRNYNVYIILELIICLTLYKSFQVQVMDMFEGIFRGMVGFVMLLPYLKFYSYITQKCFCAKGMWFFDKDYIIIQFPLHKVKIKCSEITDIQLEKTKYMCEIYGMLQIRYGKRKIKIRSECYDDKKCKIKDLSLYAFIEFFKSQERFKLVCENRGFVHIINDEKECSKRNQNKGEFANKKYNLRLQWFL